MIRVPKCLRKEGPGVDQVATRWATYSLLFPIAINKQIILIVYVYKMSMLVFVLIEIITVMIIIIIIIIVIIIIMLTIYIYAYIYMHVYIYHIILPMILDKCIVLPCSISDFRISGSPKIIQNLVPAPGGTR